MPDNPQAQIAPLSDIWARHQRGHVQQTLCRLAARVRTGCSALFAKSSNLPVRLKLNAAIYLQSLTVQQADDYLAEFSPQLDALRETCKITHCALSRSFHSCLVL
jgi:hypothetical protein